MAQVHYYKVPAIYEYEVEHIEVKDGERLSKDEKIIEEEGKRYREVVTNRVQSIRPDIPPGHNYVCELLEDKQTFFVKSEKPIRFAKEKEASTETLKSLSDARTEESLASIDSARVKLWHAGRRW